MPVLSTLRLLEGSACSHRLWGLPSSSGSPSLLHLRALAPQRHAASSWQGTVESQPPPHACSVVAWPILPCKDLTVANQPDIPVHASHLVGVTPLIPW